MNWLKDFYTGLVDKSVSHKWEEALNEWKLDHIYISDIFGECICGHDIKEHCIMINILNGNTIIVGNCCIKKFPKYNNESIESRSKIFRGLRHNRINEEIIALARSKGLINDWEENFLNSVKRKRNKSARQELLYDKLSDRIIKAFHRKDVIINGY